MKVTLDYDKDNGILNIAIRGDNGIVCSVNISITPDTMVDFNILNGKELVLSDITDMQTFMEYFNKIKSEL